MGQNVTVDFDEESSANDFTMPAVSAAEVTGRTLSLRVTGNHDRLLKALSREKVTKLVAENFSLDDVFLEYCRNDENQQ